MQSGFWKADWFLAVAVVLVFALFNSASDLLPSLENKAYDLGMQAANRAPSERIVVIASDDTSIANIGRWPWPRDVRARMTDLLAAAKAKVIGNTLFFSEAQLDPGYATIVKLIALAEKPVGEGASPSAELAGFVAALKDAEQRLNTDRMLEASYARAGNVLLPTLFTLGDPRGKPDSPLPAFVQKNAIAAEGNSQFAPLSAMAVQAPIEAIGNSAAGLGHLNAHPDLDGAVRTEPLVLQYFDQYYPSLSMMIAARSLNLSPADIKLRLGEGVTLGRLRVATDPALQMRSFFYKDRDGRPAFQVDSFYDVLNGKIPPSKYTDKIVLIGATAAGIGTTMVTPVSPAMAPVLTLANSVSSILQQHFFVVPPWAALSEWLVIALVAIYLAAVLPRLKAGTALAVSGAIFAALLIAEASLMLSSGTWLQLMLPATLLPVGHAALASKRFIVTEGAKLRSDERSAESHRMLGLAYQGQGQLDLAWDKFRQVPLSEAVLENLYSLGLDFERKRQFNKAEAVFRHMHAFNPAFRDLEAKISRAKQLSETVILGACASHPGGTLTLDAALEKPKFGRFVVEKELGKGAMGVVYLGKDPKIGREVAIKTLAIAQEFEPEELADVKERFFREAQTAGRLAHPNIVTIYDAGEEHDYCYIAMEFLRGDSLARFSKQGQLLPIEKTVSIIARAADALGYAHREGVVHRDVKPANLMYDPQSDTLKVTDFGIARLTASSKTRTGMVLGTPSYMSPEQLAGKRIDGRSDLFSLATTLYQMF